MDGAVYSRVTLDYDRYAPRFALKAISGYHALCNDADDVEVAVSSSGRGVHLTGLYGRLLDDDYKEQLRRTLGDDPNRIHMDTERGAIGHTTDVFWHEKEGNDGQRQTGFATVYDALEYIYETERSDYQRMNALANYGHRAIARPDCPRPSLAHE